MSGVHRVARRAAYVVLAAGLLAVGYTAYIVGAARVYQAAERYRFEQSRTPPANVRPTSPAAAAAAVPVEGGLVGEMQIPRLGLTAMVVQGDSAAILRRAVGHLADTALPGESGNVVLAGHRDTFFRPLRLLRVGDTITMKTRNGDFEYLVESTAVVPPTDVGVLEPTGDRTLTLITCYPFYYVGPAPDRFIVRARQTAAPR